MVEQIAPLVEMTRFLGQPNRVIERQDADGYADPHALGAGGDRRGQDERSGRDRWNADPLSVQRPARRCEMPLGQPDAVEALRLGDLHLGEELLEGLLLRRADAVVALHDEPDVHGANLRP